MKSLVTLAVLYDLTSLSAAHSVASHLIVDGKWTGLWQHVLDVGPYWNPNDPKDYPYSDGWKIIDQNQDQLGSTNITCGRNAFNSLAKTEIADVIAGEEIGFGLLQPGEGNDTADVWGTFVHPGPGQVWLSRAPNDDLKSYKGTGDWFKIAYAGPKNDHYWTLPGQKEMRFKIPATTPPGAYLVRFENFMPTTSWHYVQFYINCALVHIHSPPNTVEGVPTGFLKFPAEGGKSPYDLDEPSFWLPADQGSGSPEQLHLLNYKPPGPPVWTG